MINNEIGNVNSILKKIKDNMLDKAQLKCELQTLEFDNEKLLLHSYELDAIDIILNNGMKINYKEYSELKKKCKKNEIKEECEKDNMLLSKYNNALVYLMTIGCYSELNTFKKSFLKDLYLNFKKQCSSTDNNKTLYCESTGVAVGSQLSSGRILLRVPIYPPEKLISRENI